MGRGAVSSRGRGFKSQHRILKEHFLHLFGLKLHYLFEKAPKMNKKRQLMTQLSKTLFNITMLKKRFTKAKAWSEATLVISLTIGLPSSSSSSSS